MAGIAGAVVGTVLVAPAYAVPVAPTAVTVSARPEAVWASWTAPPGTVDHYMAWAYDPGNNVDGQCMVTGTSCLIGGLQTNVAYTVRVAAYETDQASSKGAEAISAATATPGPPSTPTAPVATVPEVGKVTLSWGAGGGGITAESFRVTSTPTSAGCLPATPLGTSCTVSGLSSSTAYTFRVTARGPGQTGSSVSDASEAITPAVPSAPTDVVVNATSAVPNGGNGDAQITWLPPASGGTVASYTALVTGPNNYSATCVETVNAYCNITGLTDASSYNIKVFANGAGSFSQPATATYIGGSPSAPDLLAATGISPTGITLNWDPSTAIGTAATNPYTVSATPSAGVPSSCVNASALTASCGVSGLTPGAAYKFRVTAAGGALGQSTYTNAFSVAARPARVENVKTSVEENGNGRITWSLPQSDVAPAGINVYEATDLATNGNAATPIPCLGGAILSPVVLSGKDVECILPSVNQGTTNFVVRTFGWSEGSLSADFYSDSASAALAYGAPGKPYIQDAVAAGAGKATITVRRPAALGAGIESYLVTSVPDAKTCTAKYIATDDPTSCTVEGLTGGTSYSFTVKALGVGGNDDSAAVTSEDVLVGPPGVATSVKAEATENSSITVSWKAPTDTTIPITSYTVKSTTGGLQCTVLATATPLQCLFDKLAAGSTYTFTVSANSASAGSSEVTTGAVTVGASAGGVPTGVQASANSGGLKVWWTPVPGVAKYQAMAMANGKTSWCAAIGATNMSCTIKPLEPKTEYTVAVRSVSAAGIPSAWSTQITAATRMTLPTIVWPATSPGGGGLKSSGGYVLYRNSRTTITGYGFLPGESVWVYLYSGSSKVRVGGATVQADGTFATAIAIPANATKGGKRLLAGGWDNNGMVRWQNAFITVK